MREMFSCSSVKLLNLKSKWDTCTDHLVTMPQNLPFLQASWHFCWKIQNNFEDQFNFVISFQRRCVAIFNEERRWQPINSSNFVSFSAPRNCRKEIVCLFKEKLWVDNARFWIWALLFIKNVSNKIVWELTGHISRVN